MPTNDNKLFIEWSHKVLEELTTLNVRIEAMTERQELLSTGVQERFGHIDTKLEKLGELLNGNGTPERGLLIRVDRLEQKDVEDLDLRVDRLEQSEGRRMWLQRATIVACLGCIGATIVGWLKGWH